MNRKKKKSLRNLTNKIDNITKISYNIIVKRKRITITRKGERRTMEDMNMTEVARLLLGLRSAGWTEKEINDFLLFIETGEEQYKPKDKQ